MVVTVVMVVGVRGIVCVWFAGVVCGIKVLSRAVISVDKVLV